MNSLRSFVALQARIYEFLEQQDEDTLQGIVRGTVQLAVLPTGEAQASVSSATHEDGHTAPRLAPTGHTTAPSDDLYQVAQDLPKLPSEHERRVYLNATGLNVTQLRTVAKMLGVRRYSSLSKAKLIDLLAGHGSNQTSTLATVPRRPERPSLGRDNDDSEDEKQTEEEPPTAQSADTARPRSDAAAVAARLREIETEAEGAAYLRTQRLDREGLLAVATELQLTRVDRLKPSELEKRVLKQAIGARRKFAGLRKW